MLNYIIYHNHQQGERKDAFRKKKSNQRTTVLQAVCFIERTYGTFPERIRDDRAP